MVHTANYRHLVPGVHIINRLSLYEFAPKGRDFVSVVRIREGPYYRGFFLEEVFENFVGTEETVRIGEVSVSRGWSVLYGFFIMDLSPRSIKTNNWPADTLKIHAVSISCTLELAIQSFDACQRMPLMDVHYQVKLRLYKAWTPR